MVQKVYYKLSSTCQYFGLVKYIIAFLGSNGSGEANMNLALWLKFKLIPHE